METSGLKIHVVMKGMGHRKSFTDPSNEAVWCVQTEKKTRVLQIYTLTFGLFALEVTNETYVFLHPVKSSQLQSISYDFHWFLQQLEYKHKARGEDCRV